MAIAQTAWASTLMAAVGIMPLSGEKPEPPGKAPPRTPERDLSPPIRLESVQLGQVLHSAHIAAPGATPHGYVQVTWRADVPLGAAMAVLGPPRIVHAISAGGEPLFDTSIGGASPWIESPPTFVESTPQDSRTINFAVWLERQGHMPGGFERLAVEVDLASRGEVLEFGLAPMATHAFVPVAEGIEARVAACLTDENRHLTVVEYRITSPWPIVEALEDAGASKDFSGRVDLLGQWHEPVVCGANAVDEHGAMVGVATNQREVRTLTGRIGVVSVVCPIATPPSAIRLSVSPEAVVRRYRVELTNLMWD